MDTPKRRGRPPGSRNREVPPAKQVKADYLHADPDTLISRQLAMLDSVQQMMRNEIQTAVAENKPWVDYRSVGALEKMSNAIVRAIDALKKSADLADSASLMTPEQLLEAAIKKIEAQDIATLNYAIKRLRAHRERIAPVDGFSKIQMGEQAGSATDAIAEITK